MTGAKSLKWRVILLLVAAGSGLFFFARMYRKDVKALKSFLAAYDHFDTAMAEWAVRGQVDDAGNAREALSDLRTCASMRLSSLIRNDGELMAQAREIAALAEEEVQGAGASPGDEQIALREKRKAAFARFTEIAGTNRRGEHR